MLFFYAKATKNQQITKELKALAINLFIETATVKKNLQGKKNLYGQLKIEKEKDKITCLLNKQVINNLVQEEGLEPTRLSALDPKSSASANFATLAQIFNTSLLFC